MTTLHPTWGFDLASPVTPALLPGVVTSGVGFVGGYLWDGSKGMTPDSVHALSAAGIRILSYYEGDGTSFSAEQGVHDAETAVALAQKLGQPPSSTIFFAIDEDVSEDEVGDEVLPHFQSVKNVLSKSGYVAGGYGSGLALERLLGASLVEYTVLGAIGWRDGHAFLPRATVVQKPPSDPYHLGVCVDPLLSQVAMITPFTWSTGAPAVPQPASPHVQAADAFSSDFRLGSTGDGVRVVQGILGVAVDGVWGEQTEEAAVTYREEHGLPAGYPLRLELMGG